jgi:actin-related protein 8
MRFYKLHVTQNAASIASTFNTQFKPEIIREVNDPYHVEWIQGSDEDVLVGEQASQNCHLRRFLTCGQQALRLADPSLQNYCVRWPIYGNQFNIREYASLQLILSDIEVLIRSTLKEKYDINAKDYLVRCAFAVLHMVPSLIPLIQNYSVILAIPDLYDRPYVHEWCHLLLATMGFKQLCAQQVCLRDVFYVPAQSLSGIVSSNVWCRNY